MLKEIKKELLDNPEKLKELLEYFNFYNVHIHQSYISFGRAQDTSKKSIVVRLEKNDYLYVTDYARNISKDLFSYISEQRLVDFKDIIGVVRNILGVDDFSLFNESRGIFGGFYEKIRKAGHGCYGWCVLWILLLSDAFCMGIGVSEWKIKSLR